MDRRSRIKKAGIASVLAAGVAPAVHAPAVIRWRLASSFAKSLGTIFDSAEIFSMAVKEMSAGKFEVSVHAAGELMPAFGVVDGVQTGTVEMAHTAPCYFSGKNEAFAIGGAIPFGMNSPQRKAWMVDGNGSKLMRAFYAKHNIVNFIGGNTGAHMGSWLRKEIKSPADIRGLRFRIGGLAGNVIAQMGGVPQNIPGGEIYQALEKGRIDAAEWIGPYDDQKLGFNKVAPFYYSPGWWEGSLSLEFYVSQKAFNSLSSENKAIVQAAAYEAHVVTQARCQVRNAGALKQLVAAKTRVLPFPQSVLDASFKASMALYADLEESNPDWKMIYGDYRNFRRGAMHRLPFAETRLDSFLSAKKL